MAGCVNYRNIHKFAKNTKIVAGVNRKQTQMVNIVQLIFQLAWKMLRFGNYRVPNRTASQHVICCIQIEALLLLSWRYPFDGVKRCANWWWKAEGELFHSFHCNHTCHAAQAPRKCPILRENGWNLAKVRTHLHLSIMSVYVCNPFCMSMANGKKGCHSVISEIVLCVSEKYATMNFLIRILTSWQDKN